MLFCNSECFLNKQRMVMKFSPALMCNVLSLFLIYRKYWLSKVGSPSSRIHRAEFSNEKDISKLEIHGFGTRY